MIIMGFNTLYTASGQKPIFLEARRKAPLP